MNFEESSKFKRDLKRLSKKYPSLEDDLEIFKSVVSAVPLGNSKHFHVITSEKTLHIVKARLFCMYLKGSSLRLVYAYLEEHQRITFIELYSKGSSADYNRKRVETYLREQGY